MLRTTYSLLSTFASNDTNAGDIVQSQGVVYITNVPAMKYSLITSAGLAGFGPQYSVLEYASNWTITPAAAVAGSVYSFGITQYSPLYGKTFYEVASYTAIAGDTTTTICVALTAILNAFKDLSLTVTNNGTTITVAGVAVASTSLTPGAPVVTLNALSNITATQNYTNANTALQGGSVTNAAPAVFTAVAHGFVKGQVITIAGVTGSTGYNGTWTVTAATSNTFTINNLTALGSSATFTNATVVAQPTQASGTYAAIALQVDPITFTALGFSTGNTYTQIQFIYSARSISDVGGNIDTETNAHTLFYQEGAANYSTFNTRLLTLIQDFIAGGTTADPLNASLV